MKKPKLALINVYFADYKMGLFNLLNKNYDITYLVTRRPLTETRKIKGTENFKTKHFRPFYFFRGVLSLGVLKDLFFSDYDIVISHDPHTFESILGSYISKLTGKKFIIYSETWDWPRSSSSKLLNPFIKLMYKLSNASIASSHKAKDYFYQNGYPKNKPCFLSLLPSLDYYDSQINKNDLEKIYPQTKNKKVLLYLNRIVPYKGLDILIQALSYLKQKDLVLMVSGTDDPLKRTRNKTYLSEIKDLIYKLKLKNIIFTEYSEENKFLLYNTCDIFIAPITLRDYDGESWGYTPEEAMSAKKPVIVTNAMGCSNEIVKNGENGLIVPHNNFLVLANAIDTLFLNKSLKKMGEKSRKIWGTITWEINFEGYKKAIEHCSKSF